jgi:hypothetical protein
MRLSKSQALMPMCASNLVHGTVALAGLHATTECAMFDMKVRPSNMEQGMNEKYIEHPHFISCSSFQNLRLGTPTQWGA